MSTYDVLMCPIHLSIEQAGPSEREQLGITVGNGVWVGERATILNGVTVGDGAVIEAGALVISDVPPYAIVRGVSARPIRRRFADYVAEAIPSIRYSTALLEKIRVVLDRPSQDRSDGWSCGSAGTRHT
jgi:acetyltransferase-like isoleucine patch superfamily enzyme